MLKVENISFSYQEQQTLNAITFSVAKGENLAVVGESGSGKTTLLKLLYGAYDLTGGVIRWNNEDILGPKFNLITGPDFMKYVAQEFDLMPFTSVEKNIGHFLSNLYPQKKQKRIDELIEVVELSEEAKTHIRYLSGGQKQRVALARAIAKQPELLLLDEPFSHIDNLKRQSLRRNLFQFLKKQNITCIVATHDKNDVLGFADSMLVLDKGKMVVHNTPQQLYNNPKNNLIASFFNECNEFKLSAISDLKKEQTIFIYPHEIKIVSSSSLQALVKKSYFQGDHFLIEAVFNNQTIFIQSKVALEGIVNFDISKKLIKLRSNN